jgi:hypothetical protein
MERARAITYDEGLFVIVGLRGVCDPPKPSQRDCHGHAVISEDGARWEAAPEQDSFEFGGAGQEGLPGPADLAAGPAGFVAIGTAPADDGGTSPVTWRSDDGLRWERTDVPRPRSGFAQFDTIVGGPDAYVVFGSVAVRSGSGEEPRYAAWRSEDGRTWERAPDGPAFDPGKTSDDGGSTASVSYPVDDVARSGERYVAVGPVTWRSEDGLVWELAEDGPAMDAEESIGLRDATPGGPGFLVLRTGCRMGCITEIWSSADGRDWDRTESELGSVVLRKILELPGGRLVATGVDNELMFASTNYSDDAGASWEPASLDGQEEMNYEAGDIALGGGRLVGISSAPDSPFVTSPPR